MHLPQVDDRKEYADYDQCKKHWGKTNIQGICVQPHTVRRFHAEMLIQLIDSDTTENKEAQTCNYTDEIEHPNSDISAKIQEQAAEKHSRVTEHALQNVVVCQGGVVVKIEVQQNTKGAADRTDNKAEFAQNLEQPTLLVTLECGNQQKPHDHITWIDGQDLGACNGSATSCLKEIDPQIAVMQNHGDNGKEFEYFVFGCIVRHKAIRQEEQNSS